MPEETTVLTDRLRLEPFSPGHAEGLFDMSSNPEVMRFLGPLQSFEETQTSITRQQEKWAKHGFGWWALIERSTGTLVGAACLQHLAHIETNPLEIGWRLSPLAQGKGYATEAGRAAMDYGFNVIGTPYVTAVAHPDNTASLRVMERLGMRFLDYQTHYDVRCAVYEIRKTI